MNPALIWIPAALLGAWVAGGYMTVRNVPMSKYSVVAQKDGYEIRQYEPYVLAETPMRDDSGNSGFRELFAYISGANTANSKLAMTVPVLQSGAAGGQKLAMTAPVLQTESAGGGVMAFVMPPGLKLEDLPRPASPKVTLRAVPGLKAAVLRFSGWGYKSRVHKKVLRLSEALARDGLRAAAPPVTAFYNPPFTAPFMRRNEVLIEIE
ncbi:MAG: heme-binding protein [Elusimicrobiales bacterium]